jgi:DNA-binding transcriptional MerR regulator
MKMEKRKFRIGELSSILGLEQFVVRFWEKEFAIKSTRSAGGQRFYDEDDLKRFQIIKSLLYEQGFTIAGARKQLKARGVQPLGMIIASQKTSLDLTLEKAHQRDEKGSTLEESERIAQQIATLQRKLVQLRELL